MIEEFIQAAASIDAQSVRSFLERGLLLHVVIRFGIVLAVAVFALAEGVIQDRSRRRSRRPLTK